MTILLALSGAQPALASLHRSAPEPTSTVLAKSSTTGKRVAVKSVTKRPPTLAGVQQFTPTTRIREIAGGRTRIEQFSEVRFSRSRDGWRELSGTARPGTGSVAVRADSMAFPAWFGADPRRALLQLRLPQGSPTMSLPAARKVKPVLKAGKATSTVTFPSIAQDTDLSYHVSGSRLDKALVLRSAKAPTSFTFHLADPQGLLGTPRPTAGGGYRFDRELGEGLHLEFGRATAWEQGKEPGPESTATQSVKKVKGGYDIVLALDSSWAKGKTYPLVLDPTIRYTWPEGTLATAYGETGTPDCSSPCPLSNTADGSVFVGPGILGYLHANLSNFPTNLPISAAKVSYYEGTDAPFDGAGLRLQPMRSSATDPQTGDDLRDSWNEGSYDSWLQPTGTDGTVDGHDVQTIDVRKAITSWVRSGQGDKTRFVAGRWCYICTFKAAGSSLGAAAPDPTWQGWVHDLKLTIDYQGRPLPPPIPVDQTFGCDCRWSHGAGVVGQRLDPINTAAGAQVETTTDIPAAAAPGISLDLVRTYNGLDTRAGSLGPGWIHGFDSALEVDTSTGDVTFRDPSGGRTRYTKQSDGTYVGAPGATATLSVASPNGWSLTSLEGEVLRFDAAGLPVSDRDSTGKGLSFTYSSDARLSQVTDSLGRSLTFTYGTVGAVNGRLTSVTTQDGRSVRYGYTTVAGASRLRTIWDLNNVATNISYDATTGALTGIRDGNGRSAARNVYDPATGRITAQTDAAGKTAQLAWDPATQTQTITDARGSVTQDVYYGNVLIKHIAADGGTTRYFYDDNLNLVSTIDPRGNTTQMVYDNRGNMTAKYSPAPFNTEESWEYDSANRVTRYIDQTGAETTTSYTPQGQVDTTTDPAGTTHYTYNTNGLIESVTDRTGQVTTYGYNTAGDQTSITDPLGNTTTMSYDAAHRMVSRTDARGNVPGCACAADYTSTWTYDSAGHVLTSTDALGRTTTSTYDPNGNMLTQTSPAGATTTYTYTALNQVATVVDALGSTTTNAYDATGNLISTTDALGRKTSYTYDAAGRLLTRRAPAGNETAATTAIRNANTITYAYDAAGNQTSASTPNPAGGTITTATTYDELDRPTSNTGPTGGVTTSAYDAANRVIAVTDPTGGVTSQSYDGSGRVTTSTSPTGESTTYEYDSEGRLLSQQTPTTHDIYTYNAAGQRTSMRDQRSIDCDCQDFTTTFTYDASGNLITTTDPLGHQVKTTYDRAGQRTTLTNGNGGVTTFTYDNASRLASVTSPQQEATAYAYDAAGNLTTRTDPRGNATTLTYDAAGQLTTVTTPESRQWNYGYDTNGNRTTITLPSGTATAALGDGTITTSYDSLGRTTARAFSDGTPSLTYTYDAAGRVVSANDGLTPTQGAIKYTYDAAGRMLTRTRNNKSFKYTYDAAGRVTSRTYPTGNVHTYSYANGRLAQQAFASQTVDFTYDTADQLTSIARSNGITTTLGYDRASRLTTSSTTGPNGALVAAQQTLDAAGNPLATTITRPTGTDQASYTYDADGRVASVCYTAAPCTSGISYQYDANSNRTKTVRTGLPQPGTRNQTYDKDDRLLGATDAAGATTATYTTNPDGQTTAQTVDGATSTFGYNLDNQLTTTTSASGATSYTYDAAGNRASATTGGTLTTYGWDENNPLAQLITEVTGSQSTIYVHGPTGPLQRRVNGFATWYTTDLQANVTDLFTQAATLTGTYRYEPFGQVRSSSGGASGANPFRFASQYLDAPSGLYNNRARQYDPTIGRFTSLDPQPAALGDPYVNAYSYGANRPLVLDDPSGRCFVLCGAVIGAVAGAVIGGATYAITHQDDNFSWGDLGKSAGVGALSGAVAGATMGLATPAITGALGTGLTSTVVGGAVGGGVGGATATVAQSLVDGNGLPSPGDVAQGTVEGAVGGAVLGPLADKAAGGVCRSLGRVFERAAPRLTQDITVNPKAPLPLPLEGRSVGRATHNAEIRKILSELRGAVTDVRINQQQVNAAGRRVGINRPDLQYTLNGKRYYIEIEGLANPRGKEHELRILANDPLGIFDLKRVK